MKQYKNSFFNKHSPYSREYFDIDQNKVIYKEYEIHKYSSLQYHIVKNDICVGMMGSLQACKNRIDKNMDL